MRTQKALKNIVISILCALVLGLGTLVVRRLFLDTFAVEYLGYTSLFNNIFAYLALAEGGIGVIINYRLYAAIAKRNEAETAILMAIFNRVYCWIGIFVAVCGVIIALLLPRIVTIEAKDVVFVYAIYFIQMLTVLSTFFLAYRKNLVVAYQQQYYITEIDTAFKLVEMILKVIAISVFDNFVFYIMVTLLCNVAGNLIIYIHTGRTYSSVCQKKYTRHEIWQEIRERKLLKDIKSIFPKQIAMTVYNGTDSILISMLVGIRMVGLYDNYILLVNSVTTITNKLVDPICASIGNLVHDATKEKICYFFDTFNLLLFYIANFCCVCFMILFQPAVSVMFGDQLLLPASFAFILSLNTYLGIRNMAVSTFRNTVGNYNMDCGFMIAASVVNIVLSLMLASNLGIVGIILGTIAGHILIFVGAYKVVNKHFLERAIGKVMFSEIGFMAIVVASFVGTYLLTRNMTYTWTGIFQRFGVCLVVPNVLALLATLHMVGFQGILAYSGKIIAIAKSFLEGKK